jgi:hypothetical protein
MNKWREFEKDSNYYNSSSPIDPINIEEEIKDKLALYSDANAKINDQRGYDLFLCKSSGIYSLFASLILTAYLVIF